MTISLLLSLFRRFRTYNQKCILRISTTRQLFSTNLTGAPNRKLRLRELVQNIKADEADGFQGSLTNTAKWDLAEDGETFDANGNFVVKCSYKINQGSRMIVDLNDHELRPARGSKIPEDVPGLVGELKWS